MTDTNEQNETVESSQNTVDVADVKRVDACLLYTSPSPRD